MSEPITHEYKGYRGVAVWDEDDGEYSGRIFGVRHILTFQGTSGEACKKSMEETIEVYLDWCQELGEEPQRP